MFRTLMNDLASVAFMLAAYAGLLLLAVVVALGVVMFVVSGGLW